MALLLHPSGGKLLLNPDGKLTADQDCCCDQEVTCENCDYNDYPNCIVSFHNIKTSGEVDGCCGEYQNTSWGVLQLGTGMNCPPGLALCCVASPPFPSGYVLSAGWTWGASFCDYGGTPPCQHWHLFLTITCSSHSNPDLPRLWFACIQQCRPTGFSPCGDNLQRSCLHNGYITECAKSASGLTHSVPIFPNPCMAGSTADFFLF